MKGFWEYFTPTAKGVIYQQKGHGVICQQKGVILGVLYSKGMMCMETCQCFLAGFERAGGHGPAAPAPRSRHQYSGSGFVQMLPTTQV